MVVIASVAFEATIFSVMGRCIAQLIKGKSQMTAGRYPTCAIEQAGNDVSWSRDHGV